MSGEATSRVLMLLATFFGGTDFPAFGKLGGTKNRTCGGFLDDARDGSPLAMRYQNKAGALRGFIPAGMGRARLLAA